MLPFLQKLTKAKGHDAIIAQNAALSLAARVVRAGLNFVQVRLVLDLIGQTQYGLWATLASVILWLSVFDLGIASGFRNKLITALAEHNILKARQLVSTAYVCMVVLFGSLLLLFFISDNFFDWPAIILKSTDSNLRAVILLAATFIVLGIIFNLYKEILAAHNLTALSEVVLAVSEFIIVCVLLFFWLNNSTISLKFIAILISSTPVWVMLLTSVWGFVNKYNYLLPNINYFRKDFVGLIANLGLKFFVIQVSSLIILQSQRFYVNQRFGPTEAAVFDISYRYFSLSSMIFTAMITPYMPLITKEYAARNVVWLRNTKKRLLYLWGSMVVLLVVMLLCSTFVFNLWLDSKIQIPFELSVVWVVWHIVYFFCAIFYHTLSSMGRLTLQAFVYVFTAALCVYLFGKLSDYYGLIGVPLSYCIVMALNGILTFWEANWHLKKIN